ncbi:MAG: PspA/IM30 family protein [Velocimicrobium sp.]
MNILTRFKDIMSANINSLLDKAEDPEKMIDQCLRNLSNDLGKVKSETAAIMAEEQRAKRALDESKEEITKYQTYAIKALEAGNEADARKFLEKKASLSETLSSLQQSFDSAASNASNMKAMHTKLMSDINELESRKDAIKGKMAVAKTQERINQMNASFDNSNHSISAFERMEEKANQALDKANAMAELNQKPVDEVDALTKKYDTSSTSVEDELARLKESLNQ